MIRKLAPGDETDLAKALALFRNAERIEPDRFLANPDCFALVAEAPDIIGWAYGYELVRPDGRSTLLIYELEVAAVHRRRGLGGRLVAACRREALARGCARMWVLTDAANEPARALYESSGAATGSDQSLLTWDIGPGADEESA